MAHRFRFTRANVCSRIVLLAAVAMTPSANHYAASADGTVASQNPPTTEGARQFTDAPEKRVVDLRNNALRANWVYQTYITDDTEQMSADAEREYALRRRRNGAAGAPVGSSRIGSLRLSGGIFS